MVERRSMNEALAMTPEQLAFIGESADKTAEANAKNESLSLVGTTETKKPQTEPPSEPVRPTFQNHALVPVTTRLQPETAAALKRAYLERKLAGDQNSTQQQIVEGALVDWLTTSGYLVSGKS